MANFTFPPPHLWPIGLRFRPTEEELITHYLKNKILGQRSLVDQYIPEIDLYNHEPWELPQYSLLESDNYEWFFFRAHTTQTTRTTTSGGWRTTGDDRPIKARGTNKVIATRKILVFYRGRGSKAVKTNWVIHEYHFFQPETTNISYQMPFVIFRLKENAEERDVSICDQNTQTQIQEALDSGNEISLTEFLNSIIVPDEDFDDVSSKMCKSPWNNAELEQASMDFRHDNNDEVNNQLLQHEASTIELTSSQLMLLNSMFDDNDDEVMLNTEEIDRKVYELQSDVCGSNNDTDTTVFHGNTRSTINMSRRNPLTKKRSQYKVGKEELHDNSCGPTLIAYAQGESMFPLCCTNSNDQILQAKEVEKHIEIVNSSNRSATHSIESTRNWFSNILTTKRIRHKPSLPIFYVVKAFLGCIMFIMFAQDMLLYRHTRC